MQCLRCGAITADDALDTRYCSNCGAILNETPGPTARATNQEASAFSGVQIDRQPAGAAPIQAMNASDVTGLATPPGAPVAASLPVPPSSPSINSELTVEAGWSEFSGATLAASMPAGAEATYPSPGRSSYSSPSAYPQMVPNDSMVPGAYSSPNLYPQQSVSGTYPPQVAPGGYPYSYAPGFMPPQSPAPKRKSPVLLIVLSVLLVLVLLIAGGVFAGFVIGMARSNVNAVRTSATTSPTVTISQTATATPDSQQLYKQVTSQSPSIIDSLQSSASLWDVDNTADGLCNLKNDGLHLQAHKSGFFHYCTSNRGKFGNFAFQIDMKILSGNAGGITFRGDNKAGNFYVFYVYSDGGYRLNLEQKNQSGLNLLTGHAALFNSGQKNTLTLIAQGDQIYLYINGANISHIQDSTYENGYLGVLADDHNAPAEVVYTNAKIWRL